MKDNPFLSNIFTTTWIRHFCKSKSKVDFNFIQDLLFYKPTKLPIYINVGKNLTKGISYGFSKNARDFRNKVFLIYDVPTYFNLDTELKPDALKLHKIKQYPGFLIKLESFKDYNEYINSTFKGKSRNKLKRDKKRLENCFDIKYQMLYGEIPKEEYDTIFKSFRKLLEKRFKDKGVSNNNLNLEEWDFYYEVAYPMIQQKKACLLVVREENRPIGLMLNFLSDDKLFQFIMVFDLDYAKFNVGTTSIMTLVEWCVEKELKILDFSKGYFDFKKRWGNLEYHFEYHLLYDQNFFYGRILAYFINRYFQIKQFLRDKRVNELLIRITFRFKNKKSLARLQYTFDDPSKIVDKASLKELDLHSKEQEFLKPVVFDFLYYNSETLKSTKVFKMKKDKSRYLIVGENISKTVQLK